MLKYFESEQNVVNENELSWSAIDIQLTGLADGGWIASWGDSSYDTTVYIQKFNSDGSKSGPEQAIALPSLSDTSTAYNTQLAALTNGGWVACTNLSNPSGFTTISLALHDGDGAQSGSSIVLDTGGRQSCSFERIASLAGGGWVVAWAYNQDTGSGYSKSTYLQQFDSAGNEVGQAVLAKTETTPYISYDDDYEVTALPDGGWIATWSSIRSYDGNQPDIYMQRFDQSGIKVGTETLVNQTTTGVQDSPSVTTLAGGGWVISWRTGIVDKFGYSYWTISQQLFDANGVATGNEILTEVPQYGSNYRSDVVSLPDGGWVTSFYCQDQGLASIKFQVYTSDGTPAGRQTIVATPDDINSNRDVIALDDGRFAVIYQRYVNGEPQLFQKIYSSVENIGPTAADDKASTLEGKAIRVDVLANDVDGDGDLLTLENVQVLQGNASVSITEDQQLRVSGLGDGLLEGQKTTVTIQYKIYDGFEYDTGILNVSVTGVNSPGEKIFGTARNDRLVGQRQWEMLYGEDGNDLILGNGGNDVIYGGDGSDTLVGGRGIDRLYGGRGNDILDGGIDGATYVFEKHSGKDIIFFGDTLGYIDLSARDEFDSWGDLRHHMTQTNKGVLIDLAGHDAILLAYEDIHMMFPLMFHL